jgi:hypothetical protein
MLEDDVPWSYTSRAAELMQQAASVKNRNGRTSFRNFSYLSSEPPE